MTFGWHDTILILVEDTQYENYLGATGLSVGAPCTFIPGTCKSTANPKTEIFVSI